MRRLSGRLHDLDQSSIAQVAQSILHRVCLHRRSDFIQDDSCAKVFCNRAGERKGPVHSGDRTSWVTTRWLVTFPVPPHRWPTQPVTYVGTALLLLAKFVGSGAGVRAVKPTG